MSVSCGNGLQPLSSNQQRARTRTGGIMPTGIRSTMRGRYGELQRSCVLCVGCVPRRWLCGTVGITFRFLFDLLI